MGNERVANMIGHAKQVHTASTLAVAKMANNLKGQETRAHVRAEGRVRLGEMCRLAQEFENDKLPRESFLDFQGKLMSLWFRQSKVLSSSTSSLKFAETPLASSPATTVVKQLDLLPS